MTEQEFLNNYDITAFDRPSVTTDIVLFTLDRNQTNVRKINIQGLQVLLIKRGSHPFRNKWALPGGFCIPSETSLETARRELQEETGVTQPYLQPVGVYSEPDRDPRGWILSNAYMGIVQKNDCKLCADTDAWEAAWFTVTDLQTGRNWLSKTAFTNTYLLILQREHSKEKLLVKWQETYELQTTFVKTGQKLLAHDLAFDHGLIIGETLQDLLKNIRFDPRNIFPFFPETFTIGELRTCYEMLTQTKAPNFRRTILPYIEETQDTVSNTGYHPAKIYKRKPTL